MSKLLAFLELVTVPLIVTGVFILLFFLLHLFLRWKYKLEHKKTLLSQLLFFALSIIAVIAVVVSIPVSANLREQILGLFGILLSAAIALSATTLLGNALAGLMIRGVRNFRLGDLIELNGYFGRVSERGLFHIEIQTEDRNLVTLPNLIMVTNPLKVFQSTGTIISTQISLGYDIGHEKIKTLLIDAAHNTGLEDPFVHCLELGDYSVLYKVSGLLKQTEKILSVRSKLNEEVMNSLHGASIEIVSPAFKNTRNVQAQKFIPRKEKAPTPSMTEEFPEKQVFEKAEQAASLENKEEKLVTTGQMISELKEQLKAAESEGEKQLLEKNISALKNRLEPLSEEIEELSAKLHEDDAPQ